MIHDLWRREIMKAQDTKSKVVKKWPSDHINHWKDKLYFQKYTDSDGTHQTSDLYVRFQQFGKRRAINLNTSNREEAARRARDKYVLVKLKGWESIEPKKSVRPIKGPTVSDVLTVLEARATHLSANSRKQYATALRLLVGGVSGIVCEKLGQSQWRATVGDKPISCLTAQAVREWRTARSKEASDPIAFAKRITHLNSVVRNARGCFAPAMQPHFRDAGLNEILCPFQGLKLERAKRSRSYRSEIDHQVLINEIDTLPRNDMRVVLIIALVLGLRRSEIDRLRWEHIDLKVGILTVQTTDEGAVKSEHSHRTLNLDPWLLKTLQAHKKAKRGTKHVVAGVLAKGYNYRAQTTFQLAVKWLRARGISSTHPLHTLRKEFGSQVAAKHGIAAAAKTLGHADHSNVTALYVDAKGVLTSGICPKID